ncbi:AbgT family transporter, partial [Tepidanaerobacter syntrophicus]
LNAANVNATIIYSAIKLLEGTSPFVAAIGIVIIVTFINGLIPSGSGKGALLIPILVPIGLSLGLTHQTTVLAYQFGDGITNMFWFSYGTLLIFLSYGKVPLDKWYKFFIPLMGIFYVIAFVFIVIALKIGY